MTQVEYNYYHDVIGNTYSFCHHGRITSTNDKEGYIPSMSEGKKL